MVSSRTNPSAGRRTPVLALCAALAVGWALASVAGVPPAAAHGSPEDHRGHAAEAAAPPPPSGTSVHERAREYFTDLPVVTQDGERLRFYSDVLEDRVVLVALIYTECRASCPLTTAKMAAVRDLLGDDFGDGIRFVSVSVDPGTDTPAVLREYAARFGAGDDGEGWLFLTGAEDDLRTIAHRLGQATDDVAAHPPFLMAGDTRRGHWRKFLPDTPDGVLAAALRDLAAAGVP